jgi:CheY-like chemotaxis protein
LHGYTLLSSGSGREALDLLRKPDITIDLLLTDVVMPGMNGRELAEEARALRPGLKVIFMSGHADRVLLPEDITGASDADLLQKPVMPTFLLRKIRNVLNGA